MIEEICIDRFLSDDGGPMVSVRIDVGRCTLAAQAEDTDLGLAAALEIMAGMIRRHVKEMKAIGVENGEA